MNLSFPPEKRQRVIVNTDAKNEADDQFAIAHALLAPSFEILGLIPAHFGLHPGRTSQSMEASWEEVNLILRLTDLEGRIPVAPGAPRALPDEFTARSSAGAELIIEEAMKEDPRPLNILFLGPLTDMAAALLIEPKIAKRNLHVVWIGGADELTHYGKEFNLSNDIHAANLVMRSHIPVSQIPYPLYGNFAVSHAELMEKVFPHGPLGRYLVRQLVEHNASSGLTAREYRSLGDSPAVGVVMAPHAGRWRMRSAPQYDPETCGVTRLETVRPVREYETYDTRFLMEDFFAKIVQFARR